MNQQIESRRLQRERQIEYRFWMIRGKQDFDGHDGPFSREIFAFRCSGDAAGRSHPHVPPNGAPLAAIGKLRRKAMARKGNDRARIEGAEKNPQPSILAASSNSPGMPL